jgi:hypothetical protein
MWDDHYHCRLFRGQRLSSNLTYGDLNTPYIYIAERMLVLIDGGDEDLMPQPPVADDVQSISHQLCTINAPNNNLTTILSVFDGRS